MKKTFITIVGLAVFTSVKAQQQTSKSANDSSGVILISKPDTPSADKSPIFTAVDMNQNFLVERESFINSFKTI